MGYAKQTWVDGSGGGTPLSATRLNFLEDGLSTVATQLDNLSLSIQIVQKAATGTFAFSDGGKLVESTSATDITLTVPPEASVAYAIGTVINVMQYGAGRVTIAPGAGVTLRAPNGLMVSAQYSIISLIKRATNEWIVAGDASSI